MKISPTFVILLILMQLSCKSPEEKIREQKIKDSITTIVIDRIGDDMVKSKFTNNEVKKSPIKIIYCKFIPHEYSQNKDVEMGYKNVSKKNIVAAKFMWYGENVFGDAADMGISTGYGGGTMEAVLKPGEESATVWNIYSRDGKTIIGSRPEEVVFEDGTKWKLSQY